jgi:mono/diheme cytochrome c family protein
MRYLVIISSFLLVSFLAGCEKNDGATLSSDEINGDNRLASKDTGEALFSNKCGYCHLAFGMGTNILTMQRIKLGEPPEKGMLTNRDDLPADYIRAVVRSGKVAMPRITKVDLTDSELDLVVEYLSGSIGARK